MSLLPALDPAQSGSAQATLSAVNAQLGVTPNLFRVAANAPAALNGYIQMSGALAKGHLRARLREQIALAVAQANGCDYCLSAHTALGAGAGLEQAQIDAARHGLATDPHDAAVLTLARQIVADRGRIGRAALATAKAAGITDAEIVETIAAVAINVFTNYLNLVAETEIDFPVVRANELAHA